MLMLLASVSLMTWGLTDDMYGQEQKSTIVHLGIFGGRVSPATDEFQFHSKPGFGMGGVLMIAKPDAYVVPVFWGLISSFPQKPHEEFGTFGGEDTKSDVVLSSGLGIRAGNLPSDLKVFGEVYLTFNLVSFEASYYNNTKQVGYIGSKIGFAAGVGVGFKWIAVGFRRIEAGGGNIQYTTLFAEILIPAWKL